MVCHPGSSVQSDGWFDGDKDGASDTDGTADGAIGVNLLPSQIQHASFAVFPSNAVPDKKSQKVSANGDPAVFKALMFVSI